MTMYVTLPVSLFFILFLSSCKPTSQEPKDQPGEKTLITKENWGKVNDQEVYLFTLTNANNVTVKITNYGGIVTSWIVPDREDKFSDIVLGYNTLDEYLAGHPAFGALIGRYANRIAGGSFSIDGTTYSLAKNNGANHLHGGNRGFDKMVWDASVEETSGSLILTYQSPDGEEGYPGTLTATVTYTLTDDNELIIAYDAVTDKPTHINLSNHSYFNLTGDPSKSILDHYLTIYADNYLPVDAGLIPTGEIRPVAATPFDFTQPEKIGKRIGEVPGGYDHNFNLNNTNNELMLAVVLYDSASGRKLETHTTEPGVQLYTGNFLNGRFKSSGGIPFDKHSGLCLETQHFPDSPNRPEFPSTLLVPGERYQSTTLYKALVE